MTPSPPTPESASHAGVSAAVPPPRPIAHDVPCSACGYNLRGLAGDPVRCPECFHEHPRESLELDPGHISGVRELQAAADALMLGILVATFGLILAPCGGVLLVIYAVILIGPALSDMKQRFRGQSGWATLLWQFVGLTIAVPMCFLGLTLGIAACGWLIGRVIDAANELLVGGCTIAGMALGTLLLVRLRVTSALRTRQTATFEKLCRMLPHRDGPSDPGTGARVSAE